MRLHFLFSPLFAFLFFGTLSPRAKASHQPFCAEVAASSLTGGATHRLEIDGLNITKILAHKKVESSIRPGSPYSQVFQDISGGQFRIQGQTLQVTKTLGSGYRGVAVLANDNRVYKFPRSPKDLPTLEIEAAIELHLQRNFEKYRIPVLGSTGYGPLGSYLQRRLIDSSAMAENILKAQEGQLTKKQTQLLGELLSRAQQYARETGIGLDLKAANLYWTGQAWGIFDLGPRTSYLPYGYTLDVPDLETYLKIWTQSEPHGLSSYLSLKDVEKSLSQISDSQRAEVRRILKDFPKMIRTWESDMSNRIVKGIPGTGPKGIVSVGQSVSHRKYSINEGRLFEGVTVDTLPDGDYTYVILEDGTPVFGRAEDELDFGVKHFQIANHRKVLLAGELKISTEPTMNVFSGAFYQELQRSTKLSNAELAAIGTAAMNVLSEKKIHSTDQVLFQDKVVPINPARYRKVCKEDDRFFEINANTICRGTRK